MSLFQSPHDPVTSFGHSSSRLHIIACHVQYRKNEIQVFFAEGNTSSTVYIYLSCILLPQQASQALPQNPPDTLNSALQAQGCTHPTSASHRICSAYHAHQTLQPQKDTSLPPFTQLARTQHQWLQRRHYPAPTQLPRPAPRKSRVLLACVRLEGVCVVLRVDVLGW
jgi:hypothetical protein